jgi:hypothetical protein
MDAKAVAAMKESLAELQKGNVRFARLVTICEKHFGEGRTTGSHHIFKVPWAGEPRINIQKVTGGKAKEYQVIQVVAALSKLVLLHS